MQRAARSTTLAHAARGVDESGHEPPKRRIALALQGGGSHGAFTWGVLDRLLREPDLEVVAISGTSAGAMNAGILADGLRRGGAGEARTNLARYWHDVGALPGFASLAPMLPAGAECTWHPDHNPYFLAHDILRRVWSPYQTDPANHNPLRRLLERIDFDGLRSDTSAARVFICATHVRTGMRRVFNNAELSLDVLLAAACLPQLYQAVAIGGEHYWDGGYTANPALAPLYQRTDATDVIVVGVNPIVRPDVPRSARGIIDRIDGISFDSTSMLELAAIAFVEELTDSSSAKAPFKPLFVHGIGSEVLGSFGASSKMNNDPGFLRHLHALGVRCTDRWLDKNRQAVGRCSTVDLSGPVPPNDGPLSGPSIIRRRSAALQPA
jgi:NTE family protein